MYLKKQNNLNSQKLLKKTLLIHQLQMCELDNDVLVINQSNVKRSLQLFNKVIIIAKEQCTPNLAL